MTEPPPDPRAPAAVIRELRRFMDAGEAREQHGVLVTDPQTGTRHVAGPYPTRLDARVAALLMQARNTQTDPELADLTYEVVLHFSPEDV